MPGFVPRWLPSCETCFQQDFALAPTDQHGWGQKANVEASKCGAQKPVGPSCVVTSFWSFSRISSHFSSFHPFTPSPLICSFPFPSSFPAVQSPFFLPPLAYISLIVLSMQHDSHSLSLSCTHTCTQQKDTLPPVWTDSALPGSGGLHSADNALSGDFSRLWFHVAADRWVWRIFLSERTKT